MPIIRLLLLLPLLLSVNALFLSTTGVAQALKPAVSKEVFLNLILSRDAQQQEQSLKTIEDNWSRSLVAPAMESYYFTRSMQVRKALSNLLNEETGIFGGDDDWYRWLWNNDVTPPVFYAEFKADLYRNIDPVFEGYFRNRQASARIRLDEIRWGGVRQDGIPPLRQPNMIAASEADYLADDHVVFGIQVNGDARAYPKRILAWHEMFVDTIGGENIAGVYCTLCGTVIPYKTTHKGVNYNLGTSGFLYRSNKLMYDKATQSLWSTERGEPVLGDLVDKGIALEYVGVVTTTWGEWRKRHPKTTVLSLDTGHRRNYNEGAAYAEYFATDELMFITPFQDKRLANKQEVLALRFAAAPDEQLAIDTGFLEKNPVYKNAIGRQKFVVFTDKTGANRVFDPGTVEFASYDGDSTAIDSSGQQWRVGEEWLENSAGKKLERLPYHRAFWFGWRAAFPETKLIK